MKRIIKFLLPALLTFQLVVFPFWKIAELEMQKEAQLEKIRNGEINPENVSVHRLSTEVFKDNVEWYEEGKEFSYHGRMYDLVRLECSESGIILFCLSDEKEVDLQNQISSQSENNLEGKTGNEKIKILKNYFQIYIFEKSAGSNLRAELQHMNPVTDFFTRQEYYPLTSPPPKVS